MTVVGTATLRLDGDSTPFQRAMNGAVGTLQSTGQSMRRVGGQMTTFITAPLVAAGAASLKFSADFQEGMANVASLIPGNTQRVNELGESVKNLAVDTGRSTGDLAAGLYQVVSAFGDSADTARILEINARSAAAGLSTVTDAIDLTSAVTKGYGDTSAEAVQHASDLAQLTVRMGQTTFPELAASMGRVVPIAAELGVTQEELFGAMATFTGVTGGAAEVSTQLRSVLQRLLSPMPAMIELFDQMGVESGEALIQQEGLQGALAAITRAAEESGQPLQKYIESIEGQTLALAAAGGQSDVFTEKLAAMGGAAGATDLAFQEQTAGVNAAGFAWKQLVSTFQVAAIEMGDSLAPAMLKVVNLVRPAIGWFADLDPRIQTVVVAVGALAAAAGPVILALGAMASGISAIATAAPLLSAVLGTLGVAVVGVGAAIGGAVVMIRQIIDWMRQWWAMVTDLQGVWEEAGRRLGIVTGAIGASFRAMVDLVLGLVTTMRDRVLGVVSGMVEGVQGFFGGMYDVLVGHSIVPDMVDAVIDEFDRMGDTTQARTQSWLGGLLSDADGFASAFLGKFGGIGSALGGVFDKLGGVGGIAGSLFGGGGAGGALGGIAGSLLGGPIGGLIGGKVVDFVGGLFAGDDKKALAEIDAWQEEFARSLAGGGNVDDLTASLFETVMRFMKAEDFSSKGKARATSAIAAAFESGGAGAVAEALKDFPRLFEEFGDEFEALGSVVSTVADAAATSLPDTTSLMTGDMLSTAFGGSEALGYLKFLEVLPEILLTNRKIEANTGVRLFDGDPVFSAVAEETGRLSEALDSFEASVVQGIHAPSPSFTMPSGVSSSRGGEGPTQINVNMTFPNGANLTRSAIRAAAFQGTDEALGQRRLRSIRRSGDMGVNR